MVKEVEKNGRTYYQCEECDMFYEDKEIAQKCETHCREKHACDLNLIKYAVQLNEEKGCGDGVCKV